MHTLKQEIIDRMNHFYLQTDGSMKFPNSCEGDLLKLVHKFILSDQNNTRYNAGLDTAYRIVQEVMGDTPEGETILCGIISSKYVEYVDN